MLPNFSNFDVYRDIVRVCNTAKLINKIKNIAEVYEIKDRVIIIFDLERHEVYTMEKSKDPENYELALKDLSEKN